MTFIPFGVPADQPPALVDGTPEWMVNSLRERFKTEFRRWVRTSYGNGYHEYRVDRMRKMELETRMRAFAQMLDRHGVDSLFDAMTEQERLQAFDWVIKDNAGSSESGNDELEPIPFN